MSVSLSGICLSLVSALLVSVPGFLCLCRLQCPCMTGSQTGRWLSLCTACCFWPVITCHLVITSPRSQCPVCAWRGVVRWRPPRLTLTYIAVPRCGLASGGCCIHTLMPSDIYIYIGIIYACRPTSYLFEHQQRSLHRSHAPPCFRVGVFADSVNQALSGRCRPTHRTFHALRNGRDLWS